MLVATRDPPLHSGAHDASRSPGPHVAYATLGVARLMTVLQVAGSLLAIPLGLASGYSIYHANFSPEAQCQNLRASIISMLDKSADASTLRMLVRRDVAEFEGSCGTVDPDAVAAFKTLLAAGKPAALVGTARAAAITAPVAHKPFRQVNETTKSATTKPAQAVAAIRPIQRDAATSDVNWLAAVRHALIPAPLTRAEAAEVRTAGPAPVQQARAITPQIRMSRQTPAPALPPAAPFAAAPQPVSDDTHPVPPASIPDAVPLANAADATPVETRGGLRLGGLIAKIPLLGHLAEGNNNRSR